MSADSKNGYVKIFSVYLCKELNVPCVSGLGHDDENDKYISQKVQAYLFRSFFY